MRLQFLGANRQVTGSKHLLEAGGARLLVDCGMYQERDFTDRNWEDPPINLGGIDAVLLTHAHVDHCGMLPRMVRQGLRAPILATPATCELAEIILEDSARIQEEDAVYKRKRHRKEGRKVKHPVVPLSTSEDVRRTLPHFQPLPYRRDQRINDRVSVRFHDAGHILGSAIAEVVCSENGVQRRFLFSGDLGQRGKPIIRDPAVLSEADYIILESTYGNRDHNGPADVEQRLAEVIRETAAAGGNIVIPVFALERAQELLYHIGRLLRDRRIPQIDVVLNSPMAVDITEVFRRHRDCFDGEAWSRINSGESLFRFPGTRMVRSVEESKQIHQATRPSIIMATSGMCTAGRIKHHLRHNITRPESTILFVGYQAQGTLGRKIVDGNAEVRILGSMYPVRARIAQIDGFSGHADRGGLCAWLESFASPPRQLFLVHGEEQGSLELAERIRRDRGWNVIVPKYQDKVVLD